MKITFEEFLKDWHMKDYHGTDDDAPDAFEAWMSELEVGDIEPFANLYGKEMYIRGMQHVQDLISKPVLL